MTITSEFRVSAETISVAHLLQEGKFNVPWHQREFDWDTGHVEKFWDDIWDSCKSGQRDYFIGSITLTEASNHVFDIQDGQQRLTTYSMMVAVLRDEVSETFRLNAQRILYDIHPDVVQTDENNLELRIRHQEQDRGKYAVIASGKKNTPNGKLSRAQASLTKKSKELERDQAENLLQYLLRWVIANKTVNKTENATQIFETLNARGKNLNQVDLLRNFLYSHLGEGRNDVRENIHRNLEEMKRSARSTHGRKNDQLDAYVRCALQCRYGHIRSKSLYEDAKGFISKEIKEKGETNAIKTIGEIAEYLSNPRNIIAFKSVYQGDSLGQEITDLISAAGTKNNRRNMGDYIRELKEYKVSLPVTFAVLSQFLNANDTNKKAIANAGHRIVQNLNALIMRTATMQRSFKPSIIEKTIAKWGNDIINALDNNTHRRIVDEITLNDRERVWDDNEFVEKMAELRFPKAKSTNGKAKRLLYALYQHEQNDLPSYDRLTLEHVLPESPEHVIGWGPHFDNDNHERYSLMPGNMTLLSPSDNKGTATFNQSFENKKGTFQNSTIRANQEIANNEKWTPDIVSNRQRRLAKIACEVWKPIGKQTKSQQRNTKK